MYAEHPCEGYRARNTLGGSTLFTRTLLGDVRMEMEGPWACSQTGARKAGDG